MPDIGLDYHKFAGHLDIISWDNYPEWHRGPDDEQTAVKTAFFHDLCRSYLNKPFLMMESSPGATNWQGISKKKKKGMHILSSIQAVAHGSDSVQYFQWRQSRGGVEKFHDAVITHMGADDTRIFREVAETGSLLKKLGAIAGTNTKAQAAVVYDFQNSWALDNAQLQRNIGKNYQNECIAHYGAFWKAGIPCDIIGPEYSDFEQYRLIVFPMLYMLSEKTAEKIRSFVKQGGIAVATYLTGIVNESDLCYLGGTPGNLIDVFGVAVEETETIADYETPEFLMNGNIWKASHYADRVRPQGAVVLGAFTAPFGELPAVTAREYGKGTACYICTRAEQAFMDRFYRELCEKHGVKICLREIPAGVSVRERGSVVFIMNFNNRETKVSPGENIYSDLLSGEPVSGTITLQPYGMAILTSKGGYGEQKNKNNPE
jgi:beta-galactosidase